MKTKMNLILIILLAIFLLPIFFLVKQGREQEIKDWAKENGYTIESIESKIVDWGPYYVVNNKDSVSIFRVVLSDGRIFWFRFWLFSKDIKEYHR